MGGFCLIVHTVFCELDLWEWMFWNATFNINNSELPSFHCIFLFLSLDWKTNEIYIRKQNNPFILFFFSFLILNLILYLAQRKKKEHYRAHYRRIKAHKSLLYMLSLSNILYLFAYQSHLDGNKFLWRIYSLQQLWGWILLLCFHHDKFSADRICQHIKIQSILF